MCACAEKSYGESVACVSERLRVSNEMRLNCDVCLLLFLEPSFCSLQLETGKTTWFDLISSFYYQRVFPCFPSLSRKMVLKNFQCMSNDLEKLKLKNKLKPICHENTACFSCKINDKLKLNTKYLKMK